MTANNLKLGNFAILLVVLAFMVGGFTFFMNSLEENVGVVGVSGRLSSLSNSSNLSSDTDAMSSSLSAQADNASDFATSSSQQLEDRASSTSGVLNLFSKNILVRFFSEVTKVFGIPSVVWVFLVGLVSVLVTILVARFFMGGDRI